MLKVLGFFFLLNSSVYCAEKVDSFIVKFYSRKVIVLSPENLGETVSVIIENRTLTKLYGKIVNQDNKTISNLAIESSSFRSENLSVKRRDKLFFIPLSPAFQAVPLIIGADPYEIPPKEEN